MWETPLHMNLHPDLFRAMTVFTMWLWDGPDTRTEVRVLYRLVCNCDPFSLGASFQTLCMWSLVSTVYC